MSLDPPIQTLADATFELLRDQYWFDAILIIDDSIVSDLFARRLSSLCKHRNGRQQHQRRRRHRPFSSTESDTYDTSAWMDFKRSSIKKSPFRVEALNDEEEDERLDDQTDYDYRKSKESSLMNVWRNLKIIRISKLLEQNEVCFDV